MILNAEKVEKALILLGIPVDRIETTGYGEEVYAHCPGHFARLGRDDSSASWSVNADSGLHNCFSCGYGGSLLALVVERHGLKSAWGLPDYDAAKKWLEVTVGLDVSGLAERLEEIKDAYYHAATPLEMSEARLAVFHDPPAWALANRGLTLAGCTKYKVRWDPVHDCWITPVRDPVSAKLWGWQIKGEGHRFFKNFPPNMRKSRTLFGFDTYTSGAAVVVESPLDAVLITQTGVAHGLSTMGAKVSEEQFWLMRQVDRLIFAFDTDGPGRKASEAALATSRRGVFECFFLQYPPGVKDPGDMFPAQIIHSVESARHCVLGRKALG